MKHVTITSEMERRKKALEAKLTELLAPSAAREELQIEYLPDPLDQTAWNTDREMALSSVDQKARLVHDVQLALDAIDDGVYGACERCDHPIPRRRLDALPWARLCVGCQSAEEAAGRAHQELPALTHAA